VQFEECPIAIITIDTLNRSLRGSESKDEDMTKYLTAAITLADRFQCCVILIHHCGHNEERPRGHSSLLGSADALIEIKKHDNDHVRSIVEEMRDGPHGAETFSRLEVVTAGYDDNFCPIMSCVIVNDGAPERPPAKSKKPPGAVSIKFYNALSDAI